MLVEVISTRLPLGVRAEADKNELATFLQRTVADKLDQLNRVIDEFLASTARLPDVDPSNVKRIWPVLVTYGDLLPAGPLSAYIAGKTEGMFGQAPTRPPMLLGIDVEMLTGLVADGSGLVDLLVEKSTGKYANLPFSRWLMDTRDPFPPRLSALEQRWWDLTDELATSLDPAT